MTPFLQQHREPLARLCRSAGIKRLAAFGSVVRSDFRPDSDVDLLVEFSDVESPGYAERFMQFADAAERILGRPVDLLTTTSLRNPYLKRRIEREAVEIHAA
ncbi:MAG: nucleotidyltransferase family protein [Opitutaceae bacterium]|nr:nucleotidyltransferase family protein [Opitutaceae bacterium]